MNKNKKSRTMNLRLSQKEKELIERLAKEKGVTMSQLIIQGVQLLSYSLLDSLDPLEDDSKNGKDDQNGKSA